MNALVQAPASDALAAADSALVKNGRSFHWARRLLNEAHAARTTRLYGFCRHLDDLADEAISPESARENLDAARLAIIERESPDPVLRDGIALLRECRIAPEIPLQLIAGLRSDLDEVRVPDEASLLRYCYRVAGTVGLMMCEVLDVHEPAAFRHAIDLGIAMQLTNICRDVAEDASAGRRYLPASMIGEVEPAELVCPSRALQTSARRCVADLLAKAERYYRSGENGLSYLPPRARAGILVAARVYRAIGVRLQQRDCAFWLGRVVISDREKIALSAGAVLGATWRSSFWRTPNKHDSELHLALQELPGIGSDDGI